MTTNTAEAWHNRLRTYAFSHLHPDLGRFIHELQIEHNSQRRRLTNLQNGVFEPAEKNNIQLWKEEAIVRERGLFNQYLQWSAVNNITITHDNVLQFCVKISTILKTKRLVDEDDDVD